MKKYSILGLLVLVLTMSSCSVWERIFPPKYGCGTNGKNVGAEQLLSGNKDGKKGARAARKARKFKA